MGAFLSLITVTGELIAGEEVRYHYQELEDLALANNSELKVDFQNWRATVAKVRVARSLPDPQISYTEFLEEVQTRVGPQRRKVSLMQMFPWFGTLDLRKDAALAKADAMAKKIESRGLSIIEALQVSVADLILLDKKISINREHLQILSSLEVSRRGSVSAGRAHLSNVLRIQVEIEVLKDQIKTLVSLRQPLAQKLERVIGTRLQKALPITWPSTPIALSHEDMERLFQKSHPAWLANQHALSAADAELNLAKKKNKPDIGLGFSWIDTGPAAMPNTAGSGSDPLAVTISMNIPLWRGKINSEIESRLHQRTAVEGQFQTLLQDYRVRIKEALFRKEDSERKIILYRDQLLPKALDAYEASKKGHASSQVSFQNVLDAERILLRFALELETAHRDHSVAKANIAKLVGLNSK
jgi:outer membrane protein TolC